MKASYLLSAWPDLAAAAWLLFCWVAYAKFARMRARRTYCIASTLHAYRQQWALAMLKRENRIVDASLLTNLERMASFLASTAILIIAGAVTILASSEKVHEVLAALPFANENLDPLALQFKIVVLLGIFIYSFFSFTWAMRQYGFCAVMVGAAPLHDEPAAQGANAERYAYYLAKIIDQAGHSYNYGLRGYYFSLAILTWLLSTPLFVCAVAGVVFVLYMREFHSSTLKALIGIGDLSIGDLKTPKRWLR